MWKMLEPITSPTGWKPTSLMRRNSFTERSLVKNCLCRICPRRSRACCGRSAYFGAPGGTPG